MWFYFTIFLFLVVLCFQQKSSYRVALYCLAGFILILVAGLRPEEICRDYSEYRRYYEGIKVVGNVFLVEPTFVLITLITPRIEWLMLIYASLSVTIILIATKRITEFYFLSLLIFYSGYFLVHEMTQIRVGVAVGLLLLCIEHIYNRNLVKFILTGFAAAAFHFSALVVLPLYFLKKQKINVCFYAFIIPVCYVLHFLGIHVSSLLFLLPAGESIQQKLMIHQLAMSTEAEIPQINVFNIIQIIRVAIVCVFLWKVPLLESRNKFFIILIKIYVFSVSSFVLFADIPVFGFRISEVLGIVEIVLIPMLIYLFKQKFVAFSLCVLYAFGTLYMAIIYGGLLKPYF
ncbi:MAG: EpsG family protein [Geobacter sp.]|nr:MAG: EpsG family protein [Geobacter sp.]